MPGQSVIAISQRPRNRKKLADTTTVELDDDGKPIVKEPDEGGKTPPPKTKDDDTEIEPDGKPDGEEEPEVPVRKSAQQHIIARQQQTIKKLRSKQEDEVEPEEKIEVEDDELTPEAQSVVAREVNKAIAPIVQSLANQADESELQELFETEPEAKEMSKQIRAYMKHPSYKGVPPSVIYHHLAFDKAVGGAVKKKTVADREAGHHKGGGSTRRPKEGSGTGDVPSVEELSDMTDEDFENLQHKARTGKFV